MVRQTGFAIWIESAGGASSVCVEPAASELDQLQPVNDEEAQENEDLVYNTCIPFHDTGSL